MEHIGYISYAINYDLATSLSITYANVNNNQAFSVHQWLSAEVHQSSPPASDWATKSTNKANRSYFIQAQDIA